MWRWNDVYKKAQCLGLSKCSTHGVCWVTSVSDSLQPCELWPARLLCPWNFPGKNTGGLPCPPPEALLDPGTEPEILMSPALAGGFSTTSATTHGNCWHYRFLKANVMQIHIWRNLWKFRIISTPRLLAHYQSKMPSKNHIISIFTFKY